MPFLFWMTVVLAPAALRGKLDFVSYYSAGRIVLSHPGSLYDYSTECQTAKLATGSPDCSPFIHPAYEALFFAPLSLLPYRAAYLLFAVGNLLVLRLVWRELKVGWELAAFAPLAITLVFGQDSIVLLGIMTASGAMLRKGEATITGMLLGLGLFRFQDIVPVIVLMLLWREWKLVRGFLLVAPVVVLASVTLVHPGKYLSVLFSLSLHPAPQYVQRVTQMVNLRALVSATVAAPLVFPLLALTSIGALGLIYWLGKYRPAAERLALAILGACLVSFHFYAHDLSLLLIPLSMWLRDGSPFTDAAVAFVMAGAMLPVFNYHVYLAALPVVSLLIYKASLSNSRGVLISGTELLSKALNR